MIQVCVLALAGLLAAIIIKKDKPEFATMIIILVSFIIAIRVLGVMGNAVGELENWESILGGNAAYISLLLKIIGITYVCDFAASLCRDSGYSALSGHVELFGKIAIMVAGFPIIRMMLDMLEGLLG